MKNIDLHFKEHLIKFPEENIKFLYEEKGYLYYETKYGICKKLSFDFIKYPTSHRNALCVNSYLENQFKNIHKEKYNYIGINYKSIDTLITIECKEHGVFKQKIRAHLLGHGCKKCAASKAGLYCKLNSETFITKANIIHKNKFDYSKTNYSNSQISVIITCPIHGDFKQTPNSHLSGCGCKKCGNKITKKFQSENSSGWSLTNWIKTAKTSKKFDSFKVYIIKCWNDNEEFYKIGRTFLTINDRFTGTMPYSYNILYIIEGKAESIFYLEILLKKLNKNNKYLPKIKFSGIQECFKKITTNKYIKMEENKTVSIEDLLRSLQYPAKGTTNTSGITWTRIGNKDPFTELGLSGSELDKFLKEWTDSNPYSSLK